VTSDNSHYSIVKELFANAFDLDVETSAFKGAHKTLRQLDWLPNPLGDVGRL
jgi:hypothetical protein